MSDQLTVTIAVPTFRRNEDLEALLPMLIEQAGIVDASGWAVDLLVVDNDPAGGAGAVVAALADERIRYCVESRPGIAAARNRILAECRYVDLLALIDDDERPAALWLPRLLDTQSSFAAAAVAGPVHSEFTGPLDDWIDAGGFFGRRHRLEVPTGARLSVAATNNLLLDLRVVRRLGLRFALDVGMAGGEDNLFTGSLTRAGGTLVWCADALVTEIVPAQRATRRWVLLRSMSSGNVLARVRLRTAAHGPAAKRLRISLLVGGLARVSGGLARLLVGVFGRSIRHRARGARTLARGVGIVLGASGYSYQAYRRQQEPVAISEPGQPR